jgi:hypothetical protein
MKDGLMRRGQRGTGIIINGGMNGGLYYFYLLAGHEQAKHGVCSRTCNKIQVGRMGGLTGGNPKNVEG